MFDSLPRRGGKIPLCRGIFCCILESPVLYFPNKLYVQLLSCSYNKERTLETMEHPARKITKIARETERLVLLAMRGEHIGTAEIDCIHAVRHHPGITQTELAAALNTDKPAIARRTASLERKGYLRREPNPADGRSQLLYATEAADGLRNSKAHIEEVFYTWLLEDLDREEAEQFCATLDKLYQKSKAQRKVDFRDVAARLEQEEDHEA